MKRVLATAAVGAALLAAASSEASAWVVLVAGAGSSGYGRDPYYVQDANDSPHAHASGGARFRSARLCGAGRECGRRNYQRLHGLFTLVLRATAHSRWRLVRSRVRSKKRHRGERPANGGSTCVPG